MRTKKISRCKRPLSYYWRQQNHRTPHHKNRWWSYQQLKDRFTDLPPSSSQEGEIYLDITPADFRRMFKKWKEQTSSSPSGRHLSNYKAILNDDEMVKLHCIMCSLLLKCGFPPTRWGKAAKLMLEKEPGKPQLNHLRVIHLLETGYYCVLKLIWMRRLIRRAAQLRLLMSALS